MKRLLFAILLVITTIVSAQEKEQKAEFPNAKNSYLTVDISTPINFGSPRYRFGYIQSLSEKWRIGVDLGYGRQEITVKQFVDASDQDDYELFEARAELYHILNPTKWVNLYISGELYYIQHTETYYNDYFELEENNRNLYYDRVDFSRDKYGVNLKFGVMVPFGEKVGVNAFIGAGPRIRDNSFSNIINPVLGDFYDDDHYDFFEYKFKKEGNSVGFNFALGLKFFYRIH